MIHPKTLSFIAWAVVSLWSRSLKVQVVNSDRPEGPVEKGKNAIYAFWHDSMFLLPHTYRNSGHVILVSESRDGEFASGTLEHFGFDVVRGSARRRGCRALLRLMNSLRKGKSIAFAVDGPRGPRHEAKAGAVFLAGRQQAPLIPVATGVKRFWRLERTWDKFVVPAPFTAGVVLFGKPIAVNGTSKEEVESKRRELETALLTLTQEAAREALSLSSFSGRGGAKIWSEGYSFPER